MCPSSLPSATKPPALGCWRFLAQKPSYQVKVLSPLRIQGTGVALAYTGL